MVNRCCSLRLDLQSRGGGILREGFKSQRVGNRQTRFTTQARLHAKTDVARWECVSVVSTTISAVFLAHTLGSRTACTLHHKQQVNGAKKGSSPAAWLDGKASGSMMDTDTAQVSGPERHDAFGGNMIVT